MNHLHFIGKQYYSRAKFITESIRYGVNRRISARDFRRISLGDRVFLIQGDRKNSQIFGFFTFSRITGLDHELIDEMVEEGVITLTNSFPQLITRGCGSYMISATYSITDPERLMEKLNEKNDSDLGNSMIMIGGPYSDLTAVRVDADHICTNIPFRMGFRPFDFDAFRQQYEEQIAAGRSKIKVIGMFYCKEITVAKIPTKADIQKIENYRRK